MLRRVTIRIGAFDLPQTEAELQAAVSPGGVLRERNEVDFKSMVSAGSRANDDLAIDLASLAPDGGLLVVGVDDRDKSRPPKLTPVSLSGLKERIANVAETRPKPPVRINAFEIPAASAGDGYVVVVVPRSPDGAHQVDHIYRGRSGSTNIKLDHESVLRIQADRRRVVQGIDALLDSWIAADPTPPTLRRQAHMFLVAQPEVPVAQMLKRGVGASYARWTQEEFIGRLSGFVTWVPDFGHLSGNEVRLDGWATTAGFGRGRSIRSGAEEDDLLEVMFTDDGGVRLFCSRGSVDGGNRLPGIRVLLEDVVYGLTRRILERLPAVAGTCDYAGDWQIGIAITNARGTRSAWNYENGGLAGAPFPEDLYRATTSATALELASGPGAVVDRLMERLNWVLTEGRFRPKYL